MSKKSWKNLTDKDLLGMIRNGVGKGKIANRYGVSIYKVDERIKQAKLRMHVVPGEMCVGSTVKVVVQEYPPQTVEAKVEYIHPEGRFVTVRRSSERKIWGDPYADSSYLFSVRPEEVLEVKTQGG